MTEMVMYHKKVYKALAKAELFLTCLRKQPKTIRQKVHTVVIALCTCSFIDILRSLCFVMYACSALKFVKKISNIVPETLF